MSVGKLVSFAIFGLVGYQYEESARHYAGNLVHAYPMLQTQMEMTSYASGLRTWVRTENGPPEDLGKWLNSEFEGGAKADKSIDYFQTAYEMWQREDGKYELRSCGGDKTCGTEDDLIVPL